MGRIGARGVGLWLFLGTKTGLFFTSVSTWSSTVFSTIWREKDCWDSLLTFGSPFLEGEVSVTFALFCLTAATFDVSAPIVEIQYTRDVGGKVIEYMLYTKLVGIFEQIKTLLTGNVQDIIEAGDAKGVQR